MTDTISGTVLSAEVQYAVACSGQMTERYHVRDILNKPDRRIIPVITFVNNDDDRYFIHTTCGHK